MEVQLMRAFTDLALKLIVSNLQTPGSARAHTC